MKTQFVQSVVLKKCFPAGGHFRLLFNPGTHCRHTLFPPDHLSLCFTVICNPELGFLAARSLQAGPGCAFGTEVPRGGFCWLL